MVGTLFAVSVVFVGLKGNDYSLFNAAKELLYFPLKKMQKTGAKYIVDMVAYRGAKGIISFALIFWQSDLFINSTLLISFLCWFITLYFLFVEKGKLEDRREG
jgi:AAA family ATP:ADP antiporter